MNQTSYLTHTFWKYQESCEFTDITLVCKDGSLPAHSALLARLFTSLGLTFPCRGELPDCLLLPDINMAQLEMGLRDLYRDSKMDTLLMLLDQRCVLVKDESKDYETSEDMLQIYILRNRLFIF